MKEETSGGHLSQSPEVGISMKDTRNFSGKPSSISPTSKSIPKEGDLPHYLTASAGSCHDTCKYGENHTIGLKERSSSFPWRSSNSTTFAKQQRPVNIPRQSDGQRKNIGQRFAQRPVKISGASENTEENISTESMIKERKLSGGTNPVKKGSSSSVKETEASTKYVTVRRKPPLPHFGRLISSDKSKAAKQEPVSAASGKSIIRSSLKSEPLLNPMTKMNGGNGQRIARTRNLATSSPRVNMKSPSREYSSAKSIAPLTHADLGERKSKERTLHVVMTKKPEKEEFIPDQPKSSSGQSSLSSLSSSSSSSSLSEHEGEDADSSSGPASTGSIATVFEHVEDETDTSPPTVEENRDGTAPTARFSVAGRVRVDRRRSTGDDLNGEEEMKKLRFKVREAVHSDRAGPKPETVILKRQDTQDKKGNVGLYNNVIEETASKLVETRMSKVKALVGAFETVISLQEGKSADYLG